MKPARKPFRTVPHRSSLPNPSNRELRPLRNSTRTRPRLIPLALALTLVASAPTALEAQASASAPASDPSRSGALYDELARRDSAVFNAAFVECDVEKNASFFTEDIEFYHDLTGFESGEQVRETFRTLLRNCPRKQGVTRELVAGSLRVYPIKDYGAVQMGIHRFVQPDGSGGTAKFVHLWKKTAGGWKITRVLSFDHRQGTAADERAMLEPGR